MYQDIKALQDTILLLCHEKGITINKLATQSGITQSTLDSIMKGKSKNPKIATLHKIADGFQMEYDRFVRHIRSAQEEISPSDLTHSNRVTKTGLLVATRLRNLRKQKKKTLIEVSDTINAYIDYEERISQEPAFEVLVSLANYFDVSADYLLGLSDNPEINK